MILDFSILDTLCHVFFLLHAVFSLHCSINTRSTYIYLYKYILKFIKKAQIKSFNDFYLIFPFWICVF